MASVVNSSFAKWATGFSGCDGGNPYGKIWLCGIEWGGPGWENPSAIFSESVTEAPKGYENPDENIWFPYNVKFLKLLAGMRGMTVSQYREIAEERPYPFHAESDFFKMNLFPIAFPKDRAELWSPLLAEATGFPTKASYQDWCRQNRFPVIKSWIELYGPELVITVGSSYRDDFFQAFAGSVGEKQQYSAVDVLNGKKLHWMTANEGRTVVTNIPFLGGPSGLNSNELLAKFGAELKNLMSKNLSNINAA